MGLWDRLRGGRASEVPRDGTQWDQPFDTLKEKWNEVPSHRDGRKKTGEMLRMPEDELLALWEECRRDLTLDTQWAHRGWYHTLYREFMVGKKVLDVGSGFAVDSITHAENGARLTFLDVAESNLEVLRRICAAKKLDDVEFVLLTDLSVIDGLPEFDVIMAMGSLHHAPQSVIVPEVAKLAQHLKIGGRWLQLAYPKARWQRDGSPSFERWGDRTDFGAPWTEWYDLDKFRAVHASSSFDVVLYQEFHNADFNWFDMIYRGPAAQGS